MMAHPPPTRTSAAPSPAARRQRGVALVIVLSTLAVLAVLATHVAVLSEITAAEAKAAASRGRLLYAAESAADRAFWMLLWDRRRYPNRALGDDQTLARENDAVEPWLMDGRTHSWDGPDGAVAVTVVDANRGLDVSGAAADQTLRTALMVSDDHDRQLAVDEFLDLFADYLDSDSFRRLHGKEEDGYSAEGWPDLPRNGPLQFREELFWLEGLAAAMTAARGDEVAADAPPVRPGEDDFRIIPPPGSSFPRGQNGAFPPSQEELQRYFPDAKDQARLREGFGRWLGGEALDQAVPADLLGRLQQHFSFQESGVATLTVTAAAANGAVRRTLRVTRDCRNLRNGNTSQPTLAYWERFAP